jgi:serpin B
LESSLDLVPPFQSLGMKLPFELGAADFSGMSVGELAISQVKHKGFIAVDEQGTEAASATAVEMTKLSKPSWREEFLVDRPFFFVIFDKRSRALLFFGKVEDPRG